MVRVLIATAMGALLGYFFQGYTDYVAVFGKVYANLLMVFVISLLLFSMIATIINIGDMKTLGSIGETDDWNRWRS